MMQYEQDGKASVDDHLLNYPFLVYGRPPGRLQHPELRVKHVLSHTSEGEPGRAFVYNGGRYNFVYGLFEQVGQQKRTIGAFAQELVNGILNPLRLANTISGATTTQRSDSLLNQRVVKSYSYDSRKKEFVVDANADQNRTAFPAAGLLSTIDDLAAYTVALDNNQLISAHSYKKITTPFPTSNGHSSPYGLGWFVQRVADTDLHWGYGYGDTNSALLVRVPQHKLSLIVLANSGDASGPFRLGYGDILRSPFALAFIKHFLLSRHTRSLTIDYAKDSQSLLPIFGASGRGKPHPIYTEELLTQALLYRHQEAQSELPFQQTVQLTRLLHGVAPERWEQSNPALVFLLSKLPDASLYPIMEKAITSYTTKGYFHPEVHYDIAQYYLKTKQSDKALGYFQQVADHVDYQEQSVAIEANVYVGNHYLQHNAPEKGRYYLWRAISYAYQVGYSGSFYSDKLKLMQLEKPSR